MKEKLKYSYPRSLDNIADRIEKVITVEINYPQNATNEEIVMLRKEKIEEVTGLPYVKVH